MAEKLLRYRGYITLSLVYFLVFGGVLLYLRRPQPELVEIIEPTVAPTQTPVPMQVYVAGAVKNPGVYVLPPDCRLVQAIEAAGGVTEEADQEGINLADYVRDGQRVFVPRRGVPVPMEPTPLSRMAPVDEGTSLAGIVNVNTASTGELDSLPCIGPVLAERIIVYRQDHGPFTDPAQLMDVKGIGEVCYARIKPYIALR